MLSRTKCFCLAAAASAALISSAPAAATPADNLATAKNSMTDIFSNRDPSAVERYFASPYRQHNTWIPDGIDPLKGLAKMAAAWKDSHIDIVRGVTDGDMVVLHSAYWNLSQGGQTAVAFDLFRFDNAGKIVEHWDALEGFEGQTELSRSQYEGNTQIDDLGKTEANRVLTRRYIENIAVRGHTAGRDHFLAKDYRDHGVTDAVLRDMSKSGPFVKTAWSLVDVKYIKPHRILAEGNFVFVQGEGYLNDDADRVVEVYDLFRVQNGKIVEHWDVHQLLAPRAKWANPNGPF